MNFPLYKVLPIEQLVPHARNPRTHSDAQMHPDVCELKHRFGRVHHWVNYHAFKQPLVRRADAQVSAGENEYGMRLCHA